MGGLGRVPVRATLVIALGFALLGALPGRAAADRGYTVAFTADRQGDITGTGNTLMSCYDGYPGCAAARNGTGGSVNNNNLPMTWVDEDADAATFNSSGATLNLPPGARVLFAEL